MQLENGVPPCSVVNCNIDNLNVTMETATRQIRTEEPFRKKWSEATCIISDAELAQAEVDRQKSRDQHAQNGQLPESTVEIVKRLTPAMPEIIIHKESQVQDKCEVQGRPPSFRTPQKVSNDCVQRLINLHPEKHKHSTSVIGDTSDWMLAERSHSRSPPSPALMDMKSRSPIVHPVSPAVHVTGSVFNFSPERTADYRAEIDMDSMRVKKRLFEEMSHGHELPRSRDNQSPTYLSRLPSNHLTEPYLSPRPFSSRDLDTEHPDAHLYMESPSARSTGLGYAPERETYRAKSRLDVDQEYVSTPKRLKSDFERQMGYRYLQQLEADMSVLRDRLYENKPETEVPKQLNCTCAIMEKRFLEMAESAYRSLRRNDTSPRGFEQFRRELTQTNEVMKDSMEVLKNIRGFCGHKS